MDTIQLEPLNQIEYALVDLRQVDLYHTSDKEYIIYYFCICNYEPQ